MSDEAVNIDAAIDRVLLFRPGATLSQIRNLLPIASRLTNEDLEARVERLRARLVRRSVTRSKGHSAFDDVG